MSNRKKIHSDSIKINLPGIQQQSGFYCGPACLQSIMSYFGVGPQDQTDYAVALKTGPHGTKPQVMAKFAKKHGLSVKMMERMTIDDLKKELDSRHPVICAVQSWGDSIDDYSSRCFGHYIVAVGYDAKNTYFLDPMMQGYWGYIKTSKFQERWIDENEDRPYDALGISIWLPYHRNKKNKAVEIP